MSAGRGEGREETPFDALAARRVLESKLREVDGFSVVRLLEVQIRSVVVAGRMNSVSAPTPDAYARMRRTDANTVWLSRKPGRRFWMISPD